MLKLKLEKRLAVTANAVDVMIIDFRTIDVRALCDLMFTSADG